MKMLIVVDCNRVIAALIKDGTTRRLLWRSEFELVAPDFILEEIEKHKEEITQKATISLSEFEIVLALFFERITIVPKEDYTSFLEGLSAEMIDPKDIPYLACALATKANGIWTHDPHFLEQKKVKIFTNIDLLRLSEKRV